MISHSDVLNGRISHNDLFEHSINIRTVKSTDLKKRMFIQQIIIKQTVKL